MGNAKQCDLKKLVTAMHFAQEAETVGDRAIYSRVPDCCERKWAADRAVTDHGDLTVKLTADTLRLQMNHVRTKKGILVQKKSSVIGGRRIFLTKMYYHRRQGYLPKLVTKMNEMPTTFVSLVVKRNCSGGSATVSFMGISRSELFPGFNRYTTE